MASMRNQKSIIVSQTKHPAKNRIKTVKSIETTKANPTHIPNKGQPSLRSEKHYCKLEILIKWSKSNHVLIIY